MKYLINDNIREPSPENIQRLGSLVSDQRLEKANNYCFPKDKILSLESYILLCKTLKEEYHIEKPPLFNYTEAEANGKPTLKDHPEIHFNISHCDRAVAAVVADHKVGIDIDIIDNYSDYDLCKECFNEAEFMEILSAKDMTTQFATLWTKKEAYCKLLGTGISNDIRNIFTPEILKTIKFTTYICKEKGYVCTICNYSTDTPSNL